MFFILPIRTSIRPRRTPYANYALIAANVLIFMASYSFQAKPVLRSWAEILTLTPARPELFQFISYAFLHGSFEHILFNMFFLYLFGNNVNEKLGNLGYIIFFLAGAVFSGFGHAMLTSSPVLGASGAVAAVTGAYLVLFPQTLITVFYWLIFFIDTFQVSALYFIAFKLILIDNVIAARSQFVAYDAHLAGYTFGIIATLLLLKTKLLESDGFDLFYMLKQWNRRRIFRDAVAESGNPFSPTGSVKRIKSKEVKSPAELEKEEKIADLRITISKRVAEKNLSDAARLYLQLMDIDPQQVLPRQTLLDIANQLASENKPQQSAAAYEQFLRHFKNYEYSDQVQLMLGILYSRYLQKPDHAAENLKAALEKLHDPEQVKMCKEELRKLES